MVQQAVLFDWIEEWKEDGKTHHIPHHDRSFAGNLGNTEIKYEKESLWGREKREKLTSHLLDRLFPMSFVKPLIDAVIGEMRNA